jgi:hypothetical protein
MEAFAQYLKRGMPACRAYELAGYRPNRGNAVRLKTNERVKRRVIELMRHIAVKTAVTIATLTDELNEIAEGAKADAQWSAARAAIETKAKLHGHLVERREVGQPGDFANLTTEQVKEKLAADHGPEALKLLEAFLQASQGQREAVESETSIDKPKVVESERSLSLFRH